MSIFSVNKSLFYISVFLILNSLGNCSNVSNADKKNLNSIVLDFSDTPIYLPKKYIQLNKNTTDKIENINDSLKNTINYYSTLNKESVFFIDQDSQFNYILIYNSDFYLDINEKKLDIYSSLIYTQINNQCEEEETDCNIVERKILTSKNNVKSIKIKVSKTKDDSTTFITQYIVSNKNKTFSIIIVNDKNSDFDFILG